MNRIKKHKVKSEKPEASTSHAREREEHDLAYYIHDRVELMHQVFSILKPKDLKAMAPECVRHISIDDLQELCLEELLGISSKRLCAILDGAEPPSDTESSSPSPERLETISLDSISSDEDILSQASSKKHRKHKHRRRDSKSKSKHKKAKSSREKETQDENANESEGDRWKASRAGLTVLELLELQARARAIRAQLQQEQANQPQSDAAAPASSRHTSDDEVEIKEEPAEVVEISSEDEKPDVGQLQSATSKQTENTSQTVTKKVNDLVITVPQTKPSRKIKLNRNKVTVSVSNVTEKTSKNVVGTDRVTENKFIEKSSETNKNIPETYTKHKASEKTADKTKEKSKRKKKKEKKRLDKEGSDHDEITLQLSDTEKMDLLEDLHDKSYKNISNSNSDDSETSSSESDIEIAQSTSKDTSFKKDNNVETTTEIKEINTDYESVVDKETTSMKDLVDDTIKSDEFKSVSEEKSDIISEASPKSKDASSEAQESEAIETEKTDDLESVAENVAVEKNIIITRIEDIPEVKDDSRSQALVDNGKEITVGVTEQNDVSIKENNLNIEVINEAVEKDELILEVSKPKEIEKDLSEGEITEQESSEVEAMELQPEVVCISDEETTDGKSHKKKKKKDKKSKKEKKSKKSKSDFREGADQNFYRDSNSKTEEIEILDNEKNKSEVIDKTLDESDSVTLDDDDVYEILELSDDSSCYEVEGVSVLSKEPTTEEIEALSAKIDEIEGEREDVVTDEQIREHERLQLEKNDNQAEDENLENISWKDRYLGSKKVKKVLSTSNILNALRKKNKELKKKLEESKKKDIEVIKEIIPEKPPENNLEEGSIEHYNTLQSFTKYVDPVPDPTEIAETEGKGEKTLEKNEENSQVMREMKKDAKQLLKMYKKLLKYNDMNKQKDPNKKKKKKKSKDKDKHSVASTATMETTQHVQIENT